jgi:hypothetical protein
VDLCGEGDLALAFLKGEAARATCGRGATTFVLVVGARLLAVDERDFRTPIVALLFTLALGRGPGVGDTDVGKVLRGEGGRLLLYSMPEVTLS